MADAVRSLIGRDDQLAELAGALRMAETGRGGLAVVSGEAGIGKTWLAREVAGLAERQGAGVGWASCWEEGGPPAYWPWVQLWRQIAEAEPDLPDAAELVERLLSGVPRDVSGTGTDRELARFALFDAVQRGVRAAAARRPWLLVIDDMQWADSSSVTLLDFLARQLAAERVLVLATVRDDPGAGRRLPGPRPHAAHSIALSGLDTAALARLVATDDPITADVLHRRTRGNPLFATELASLARSQGVQVAEVDVPPSVLAVLSRRLDVVSATTRGVLQTAATIGTEFGIERLAAVEGEVLDALDEAAAAGLILPTGERTWSFRHGLLRDVLDAELGVAGRVRRHERVADALVELAAGGAAVEPAVLARHFAQAAPAGRAADAVAYALAAARAALAVAGYQEAAGQFRTAVELLDLAPAAADRGELLVAQADAELAAGGLDAARTTCLAVAALARDTARPELLAQAALLLSGGLTGFEVPSGDPDVIATLTQANAAVATGSADWVRLTARLSVALFRSAPGEERRALSAEAVRAARDLADPALLAAALAARCDAMAGPADVERRQADAGEIVALASAAGDVRGELLGRRLRVVALLECGSYREADAEIAAFARRVEAIRQPLYAWYPPLWRAMRAAMIGAFDDADRELSAAEAAGQRAGSANAAMLVVAHRWSRLVAAREREAQRELLTSAAGVFGTGELDTETDNAVSVALADAVAGDVELARARFDRLAVADLAALLDDSEWLPMMVQVAELAVELGGHPVVQWAYDALLPYRDRHAFEGIGAYCHGSVERPLGMLAALLGRSEDAMAHLAAALAANRAAGAAALVVRAERDAEAELAPDSRTPQATAAVFRRDGEVWSLRFGGRAATVKDSKGMRDLGELLARPGAELAALDLAGVAVELRDGDLGEVIDAAARSAYRVRLAEIDAELAEADTAGDTARSSRASDEREALLGQLTAAYGLGGRVRRGGDKAERARSAVTWRIRDAVRRIEAVHPELGHHLRHSVRTGRFCSYRPEQPVPWTL